MKTHGIKEHRWILMKLAVSMSEATRVHEMLD